MADELELLGSTPCDTDVWEAVLNPQGIDHTGQLFPVDDETFDKWVAWIDGLDGQVVADYRRSEAGLTFVPVRLDAAQLPQASRFNPLRTMRPMPMLRPIPTGVLRSTAPTVLPPIDSNPEGLFTTAIFDGGVHRQALLDHVHVMDCTGEPEDDDGARHGTAVTGAVAYGLAEADEHVARPASNIDHYRIYPTPGGSRDIYIYSVLDEIERVLTATPYPIVNLSLGPDVCVEDHSEPNRWTSTLDRISYEHDVLFVTAAGNNGSEDAATGLNRVQSPADMANGVSVGACGTADGPLWERTAYSAIGPGRAGSQVQPNGVQFGGDLSSLRVFVGWGCWDRWHQVRWRGCRGLRSWRGW